MTRNPRRKNPAPRPPSRTDVLVDEFRRVLDALRAGREADRLALERAFAARFDRIDGRLEALDRLELAQREMGREQARMHQDQLLMRQDILDLKSGQGRIEAILERHEVAISR